MQRSIEPPQETRAKTRQGVALEDRPTLRQAEICRHPRFAVFGRTFWFGLIASGCIPSTRIAGARVVRVADLDSFLENAAKVEL